LVNGKSKDNLYVKDQMVNKEGVGVLKMNYTKKQQRARMQIIVFKD